MISRVPASSRSRSTAPGLTRWSQEELIRFVRARGASIAEATHRCIREQPAAAIGVALGFGILFGWWMKRK
jgi:ElaB/YqjD/DUF883 family membrane-anchored ribosome-binding protein